MNKKEPERIGELEEPLYNGVPIKNISPLCNVKLDKVADTVPNKRKLIPNRKQYEYVPWYDSRYDKRFAGRGCFHYKLEDHLRRSVQQ